MIAQNKNSANTKLRLLVPGIVLTGIVMFLAVLGFQASQEWQRNAATAADRRADELAALLIAALAKDMQGAQQALQVLEREDLVLHPPYDTANTISQIFSRFPYPESFFVWTASGAKHSESALFNRSDRPPEWAPANTAPEGYPVTITASEIADRLSNLARGTGEARSRFAFYHTTIGEKPYQVVARKYYSSDSNKDAVAVIGFTVNLAWVRQYYFPEVISQVEHIGGRTEPSAISWRILDETDQVVIDNGNPGSPGSVRERSFPLAFFNSASVPQGNLRNLPLRQWRIRFDSTGDSFLEAANDSARNTKSLILLAAVISIAGILLSMYLWHSYLQLESMKTEFVARASHELKTPLASISLVGETLSKGRYSSGEAIREYGAILLKESTRLMKLVENLLTFSRVADLQVAYSMADTDIQDVVAEALERLKPQLSEQQFDVLVEGPDRESKVRCDRTALVQAFENVIENAIRYSGEIKAMHIELRAGDNEVCISFRDSGKGIASEDLPHLFDRFYRGRNSTSSAGSGLGLSIAQKIVKDHGGSISVASAPGKGTTVNILLPAVIEVVA